MLMRFLVWAILINFCLSYALIFHPPPFSDKTCAKYIALQYPEIAAFHAAQASRSLELVTTEQVDTIQEFGITALSTRSSISTELDRRDRDADINRYYMIGCSIAWPLVQGMAGWNMIAACQDTKDNIANTINCVWGAITSALTLSAAGVKAAIWFGKIADVYFNYKRDLASHPQFQSLLDELANITGHQTFYHGLWDHAKLGLNYSEVLMENDTPLHIFGLKAPDGSESHFTYFGNSTGVYRFKLGMGAPGPAAPAVSVDNTTIKARGTPTIDNQFFKRGGIDFMVDPNLSNGGFLDYVV